MEKRFVTTKDIDNRKQFVVYNARVDIDSGEFEVVKTSTGVMEFREGVLRLPGLPNSARSELGVLHMQSRGYTNYFGRIFDYADREEETRATAIHLLTNIHADMMEYLEGQLRAAQKMKLVVK